MWYRCTETNFLAVSLRRIHAWYCKIIHKQTAVGGLKNALPLENFKWLQLDNASQVLYIHMQRVTEMYGSI